MKAEDTVMSKEQTNEIFCPVSRIVMPKHRAKVTLNLPEQLPYLEAQAEITWDKCREQTVREILEKIETGIVEDSYGSLSIPVGYKNDDIINYSTWYQSLKSLYLPKEVQ